MTKTIVSLVAGAFIGAAMAAPALADPAASFSAGPGIHQENPNIVNIADRRNWDRDRDGRRCRSRTGECRHYYRGYYYETPWWTLPLAFGGAFGPRHYGDEFDDGYADDDYADYADNNYGDAHVQWCLNRYRSYDPRTNTWVSYSGQTRECVSPYS